ncbi:MAG: type II toxin-antitoxin system RelE/ParE family toxin [Armatimonadetes bacterium]|nr:type II toxin-antitoxin system RelE/ParE family toxin [Armatimonadota bacterium]MCX7968938.1 type II toxin-antitoxin system RelE/ParE family toxin [Armatimonadota bacterium]MDW8144421.1 type II toxin-antitoxin system RelE/ParE family toxin [Armatimonadota bacterium]
MTQQPWQFRFTEQAEREIDKLSTRQPKMAEAIARRIRWLVENADFIQHEKMTGAEEYSLHVGQFRILYTLDFKSRTITIVDIGKHNEAYRRLQERLGRRRR